MMAEKEEEKKLPMDEMEDEGTAVSYSDTTSEAAKPDFAISMETEIKKKQ